MIEPVEQTPIERKLRARADYYRARTKYHELSPAACMVWATEEIDRLRAEVNRLRRSDHRVHLSEEGAATVGCDCPHDIRRHSSRRCMVPTCACLGRRV